MNTIVRKGVTFFFLIGLCLSATAQKLPWGYEHVITVKNYSDWGKGYLTIIDNGSCKVNDKDLYITHVTLKKNALKLGDLILEVNGEDAYGWTPNDFYKEVDNKFDTIVLTIRRRFMSDFEVYIIPNYTPPQIGLGEYYTINMSNYIVQSLSKLRNTNHVSFEDRKDNDYDFFYMFSYDYAINSSDPLLDKEILDRFKDVNPQLSRDEKNPDIVLTISRDINENISTTYIPPSTRTINTGSTTTAKYNFYTKRYDRYETRQNYTTVQDGGYTKETHVADLYLQIAALDAKKINDPNITYPPIIWQSTAKRHVVNPNFDIHKELENYAAFMQFPPADKLRWVARDEYLEMGVVPSWKDNTLVADIKDGSWAYYNLKVGDKLLNVKLIQEPSEYRHIKKWQKKDQKIVKKGVKEEGWSFFNGWFGAQSNFEIEVLRNGQKLSLRKNEERIKITHFFWE